MHTKFSNALLLPLFASAAVATNDWSVKCKGECSYDTNGIRGQALATVNIAGSSAMVSDITSAAGWEILDCPADWSSGSSVIRLVCTSDDPAKDCDDIQEDGAVNTAVRLPELCGTGPFARIATWDVSKDQTIPTDSEAERKLRLRKRATPIEVMEATLDWALGEIPSDRGTITFDIRASNDPQIRKRMNTARDVTSALRSIKKRQFGFLDDIGDAIGDAVDDVGDVIGDVTDGAEEVVDNVGDAIGDVVEDTGDFIGDVTDGAGDAIGDVVDGAQDVIGDVGDTIGDVVDEVQDAFEDVAQDVRDQFTGGTQQSGGVEIINIQQNVTLLETRLSCDIGLVGFDATADVTAVVDVKMNAGYAFKIAGTLVPPGIVDFGLAGAMSGRAQADFNINLFLSGDISAPPLQLLDVGIPGLSLPGLINLGPQVGLDVRLDAVVDMTMNVLVPVTWDIPVIDFVFPPELAPSGGEAVESQNVADFQVNFAPGPISGAIELHIIPRLEFGIDALRGLAVAEVFVAVDVDGTFAGNGTLNEDFSMEGCMDLSVGININAGATGSFLTFFNTGTTIPIFQKRARLFEKCFSNDDGPASALLENGDGTFTNALGDLVNANGQLIDEEGNVIPDEEAADIGEGGANEPILDEAGNPVPPEDVIINNGDGTFEDADGNPLNEQGQRIDASGALLGCELALDNAELIDDEGEPIPLEDAIFPAGEGFFTNANCELVDSFGQRVDQDGNVIDFEPFLDDNGAEIPFDQIVIDNEDGTFSDAFGNPVDEFGGAIDIDADGNVLDVPLTPVPAEDPAAAEPIVEDETEPVLEDPAFTPKTPDELRAIAEQLINRQTPIARVKRSISPDPHIGFLPARKAKRALGCKPTVNPNTPPIVGLDQLTRFF